MNEIVLDGFGSSQTEGFIISLRPFLIGVPADHHIPILITHKFTLLDLVDRLIILDEGKVVADGPKDKVLAALKRHTIRPGLAHDPIDVGHCRRGRNAAGLNHREAEYRGGDETRGQRGDLEVYSPPPYRPIMDNGLPVCGDFFVRGRLPPGIDALSCASQSDQRRDVIPIVVH